MNIKELKELLYKYNNNVEVDFMLFGYDGDYKIDEINNQGDKVNIIIKKNE